MVLVVGATGNLGGRITRRLLDRGYDVRILVRPGSDYRALADAGAVPVTGDLGDTAALDRACAGVAAVVTTANSAHRGGADTVDTVERAGNRNLIDAAARAGVRRFVFISALGADPASPVPFMRGKAEAERHLRDSGLEYVILEPNVFIEVWVGMLVAGPALSGQPVTLVSPGRSRHTFVAIDDVADLAAAAVDHPQAANRTIVLGGPEPLSWRDIVAVFERVLGRPVETRFIEPGQSLPGLPQVVTELATAFETYETAFDSAETARTFGLRLTGVETFARALAAAPPQPAA